MSYLPPSVGPAGLSIPSYEDILADNIAQFLKIYGANQYVGTDSAIYQLLSILSLKMSDVCQGLQYVYNQSSPLTAIGAGLDRIVKLNGIARLPYTYSTATLTVTGTPGTVITNGVAQDVNGFQWALATPVTIPGGGTISVVATCTTAGNITAEPGTITIIATPAGGWTSVTNAGAAVPGNPIETDSQLRARQAISVALPSQTMLDGVIAAVAAVTGVTRYNIVENNTNSVDGNGNPPHSINAVVEGGTNAAVASAIYAQRGLGVYTNGTTSVVIIDPTSGLPMTINFFRPTYVPIYVTVQVHPLNGWTSGTLAAIQAGIVNYLNALQIGEEVVYSELYGAALTARPNPDQPIFSIRSLLSGIAPSPSGTSDIVLGFNQVSQGITANVVVTQV